MRRLTPLLLLPLAAVALAGCGAPPKADVGFRYTDAQGQTHDGALECRRPKDSPVCARLLNDPTLLDGPRRGGASIDQYFGPERLGVTGVVAGRQVQETFTRSDGAEEEAFQRAAGILLPAIGMAPPTGALRIDETP